MKQPPRLKRTVIKEELVALTGDTISAAILHQFLYWSERTQDSAAYMAEEGRRRAGAGGGFSYGWIYKSTDELTTEVMAMASRTTINRRVQGLVAAGWLAVRNHPTHHWDKTKQYRPDLLRIVVDLDKLGYTLQGYPWCALLEEQPQPAANGLAQPETSLCPRGMPIAHDETTTSPCATSISHDETSTSQRATAIPEITTKITTENPSSSARGPHWLRHDAVADGDGAPHRNAFLAAEQEQERPPTEAGEILSPSAEAPPTAAELLRFFTQNIKPTPTPFDADQLAQLITTYGARCVRHALEAAAKAGTQHWNYVETVCRNQQPGHRPPMANYRIGSTSRPEDSCPGARGDALKKGIANGTIIHSHPRASSHAPVNRPVYRTQAPPPGTLIYKAD